MRVDDDTFNELFVKNDLYATSFVVENKFIVASKNLFDEEFKKLNATDKNFIYTCVCNEKSVRWKFAYTEEITRNRAQEILNYNASIIVKEISKHGIEVYHNIQLPSMDIDYNTNCVCPYL